MPAISPIAHPVRQCRVAETAVAVSARPAVGRSWCSWWWSSSARITSKTIPLRGRGALPGGEGRGGALGGREQQVRLAGAVDVADAQRVESELLARRRR